MKVKYLAKYSFLTEVILLKAGEGFKIAVHHHLDQPIMSIQELDLSPGSVFQVCQCRSSISFFQRIIKGQLISKCLFGIFNSSKKETKKFVLWYLKSNCFRSFFGRIEDTQKDISKLTDLYLHQIPSLELVARFM